MARDTLVDRLKGYACFLVVVGHVLSGNRDAGIAMPQIFGYMETFIWTFHVSLFLFLSGQVYRITGGWESKINRRGFIAHKGITLGVPYIVFSVVYILMNSLAAGVNNRASVSDILYLWRDPIAQYWYLYALFFLFVIWAIFGAFKNWQITLGVVLLAYVVPLLGGTFGFFEVVMYSTLAFGLGTCVKISTVNKGNLAFKIAVVLAHLAAGGLLVKFNLNGNLGIKEALIVFGIYASILLISEISKIEPVARLLDFINKYSFQIFLVHTIFTAAVRTVLIKVNITQWYIHLPIGIAVGIGCSVFVAIVAQKLPPLNRVFFPLKKSVKRSDKNAQEIN